ncbi:MAG: signal recognition particle-docking protein FtsY [Clostridia bacterium]|jgi:fused signal recognition particle receptor|nr:signal recognition particle-docking protein FtsY [Clostridia bacterium]
MANFFKKLFGKDKEKDQEEDIQQEELLDGEEQLSDEEIEKLLFEEEDLEVDAVEELEISEVQAEEYDEPSEQEPDEESFQELEISEIEADVVDEDEEQESDAVEEVNVSFFSKLKDGLFKTRKNITDKINDVLSNFKSVDEDLFEELEEILITSDVGVETTMRILDNLRLKVKQQSVKDPMLIKGLLKQEMVEILGNTTSAIGTHSPEVILIIGVNGVGKTTSIGKISSRLKKSGKKVLIAAADTFRAAAIDQLEVWGNRAGVDVIRHQEGSDPAAVIFDAISAAKSRKTDVLICDTAGRLHNKKNLMEELRKIFKVIDREYPEAHKEVMLVLDATTGQNAIAQAKVFKEVADITGIILTKLDGTAKGGIVIGIKSELDIPVKLIGVGEKVNDLQEFVPEDFVNALFGE